MARTRGFTLIELLVVMAVVAIVAYAGAAGLRALGERTAAEDAPAALAQLVRYGSSAAAARGRTLALVHGGGEVRLEDGGEVLRRYRLPEGVTLDVPAGTLLYFEPAGTVSYVDGIGWRIPLVVRGERVVLEVARAGEAREARP